MPIQLDGRAVFEAITPSNDVDAVAHESYSAVARGNGFQSCTPGGVMHFRLILLRHVVDCR